MYVLKIPKKYSLSIPQELITKRHKELYYKIVSIIIFSNASFISANLSDVDALGQYQQKIQFLHWLVGNIQGYDVQRGETLAEFVSSGPTKGSGFHRYVFLVFRQRGYYGFEDFTRLANNSTSGRNGVLTIEQIARKYQFTELTAGNFYVAQYDEYSDVVLRSLGIAA